LGYHNRVRALPNSWLDKLALIAGFWDSNLPHRVEALSGNWRSAVRQFTDTHGQHILYDELDISIIVEREKALWVEDFLFDTEHSSLQLCSTVYKANHSDYQYSDYLSTIRCYPHRRLISRLRCGCHALHVDTERFGKDSELRSREDRVCLVCMSGSVEDEHHFLFDRPTYNHIRQQYSHLFHQASPSVAAFLATDQHKGLHRQSRGHCLYHKPHGAAIMTWWTHECSFWWITQQEHICKSRCHEARRA